MADEQDNNITYDVLFIGGGLASGLAAYLLKTRRPNIKVLVIESRTQAVPAQTWSFQTLRKHLDPSELKTFSDRENSWLNFFVSKSWDAYDVRFPTVQKKLSIPYHSIRSTDFWEKLTGALGPSLIAGEEILSFGTDCVVGKSGRIYKASQMIDARGWAENPLPVAGYQKFIGLNVRTKSPHGLKRPLLMDGTVPQTDGFRFLYSLPWSDRDLLIEDTCYSNSPDLDVETYRAQILQYAKNQNWKIETIGDMEQGALPLPSYSKATPTKSTLAKGMLQLGARAGLFHPTTGYSIYEAVLAAEELLRISENPKSNIAIQLQRYSLSRWDSQEFYRRLNNMLFFAAEPEARYRVLERFYEHDEDLISRFYAGTTTTRDKLRIMSGKPPIAMNRAVFQFFNRIEV